MLRSQDRMSADMPVNAWRTILPLYPSHEVMKGILRQPERNPVGLCKFSCRPLLRMAFSGLAGRTAGPRARILPPGDSAFCHVETAARRNAKGSVTIPAFLLMNRFYRACNREPNWAEIPTSTRTRPVATVRMTFQICHLPE